MLRRKKFSRVEIAVAYVFASLLFAAGSIGLILAISRGIWQPGLASVGALAGAWVYLLAARRGRPL